MRNTWLINPIIAREVFTPNGRKIIEFSQKPYRKTEIKFKLQTFKPLEINDLATEK